MQRGYHRPRKKNSHFCPAPDRHREDVLTRTGQMLGTPAYMAPEQARGESVDFRADLFSLGSVLYQLATGATPFRGSDIWKLLYSVVNDDPTPPHQMDPAIPSELSD